MIEFDIEMSGLDRYTQRLRYEMRQAADRGVKRTAKAVIEDISAVLDKSFKHAVDDFYNDPGFKPNEYERTFSLYDLMEKSFSFDESTSDVTGSYGLDPTKMTTFRDPFSSDNNGLYDQVFRKGWHGGADKVSADKVKYPFQAHPEPGVPHYRYPKPYYRYWGERAAILIPSPLERFDQYVDEEIDGVVERGTEQLKANVAEEFSKIKY